MGWLPTSSLGIRFEEWKSVDPVQAIALRRGRRQPAHHLEANLAERHLGNGAAISHEEEEIPISGLGGMDERR
jgi:hypothetical protein